MTPEGHLARLRNHVASVREPHLRALLAALLDEHGAALLRAPAAAKIHHAWPGGLVEHTLSVLELGLRVCDHYPQLDRDLVIGGCLLHDLGKLREISPEPGFDYTPEGKLVGHLVISCQWIREGAARIEGFPRELEWKLTHLVVSHHGRIEYGSPREPAMLEAVVVHAVDELDSRLASFGQLLAAAEGPWTDRKNHYGRALLKPAPVADDRRFAGPGLYREES